MLGCLQCLIWKQRQDAGGRIFSYPARSSANDDQLLGRSGKPMLSHLATHITHLCRLCAPQLHSFAPPAPHSTIALLHCLSLCLLCKRPHFFTLLLLYLHLRIKFHRKYSNWTRTLWVFCVYVVWSVFKTIAILYMLCVETLYRHQHQAQYICICTVVKYKIERRHSGIPVVGEKVVVYIRHKRLPQTTS